MSEPIAITALICLTLVLICLLNRNGADKNGKS